MCGIFGLIGNHQEESIDKSLIAIQHRGPDDSGAYTDDWIKLGFRRLSIIDLSTFGHQPMTNEDKSIWVIFNGEIYNYLDIKKELIHKHKFVSQSDTEILIHGYEQWGIDKLLKKINGMFAFCLYDKKKKLVYLVRDRIGKKPLYYIKTTDYVAFASEVKAFFPLKKFKFLLDRNILNLWFTLPYLPLNNKTIIKNINKVPPGHYLKIDVGRKITIKQYWQKPASLLNIKYEEAENKLEKLLVDSVLRRLMADVPLGVLLSGGVDSSLITAIASKNTSKRLKTITVSFKNTVIDDYKVAKQVARYCSTEHINLFLKIKDIYLEFKENIGLYDDLSTADSGLFSEFLLSKEIRRQGIIVALVGEGADEIFAGYSWFKLSKKPYNFFPSFLTAYLYQYAIMRNLPWDNKFYPGYHFIKKQLGYSHGSLLKKIQSIEMLNSLPNHYCMKVDKGTMGASIEARAPYMDYRIIEFASQMPDQFLLNKSDKFILRNIAKKYLPVEIAYKKKKGGMMPVYEVLEEGLKKDSNLILENDYLTEFYGKNFLKQQIQLNPKFAPYKWQREWVLWKSLTFALWYNHFSTLK